MRRVFSRDAFFCLLVSVIALAAFLWPAIGLAAGAKSVAILIEGADSDSIAAEVQGVLPAGLGTADAKGYADALRKAGQSGQIGSVLWAKGAARDKVLARAKKAMEAVGADAAILARVRLGKTGKELFVVWLSGSGDVRVEEAVSLRGDADERRKGLHSALDSEANALVPAPEKDTPEPTDKPPTPNEPPKKDTVTSSRTTHLPATELFDVGVAFEMGGRHLTFTDAISQNIRPYDVLGAPMIAVQGAVYPAATTGIPVLKNIGLTARASFALGLSSSTKGGKESISTSWIRFRGGLKWRFVPGTERGPVLALTGDFGFDTFSYNNAGDLAASVPAVDYKYVRAGGEVRLPIGPIAFEIGGGYRGLLSVGELGGRFTKPTVLAFDGFVGFTAALPAGFEVRLSGDYTRVVYAFSPVLGDTYVAGGAVDEMLGARLGAAYVY